MVETLIEWLREALDVHLRLFRGKTSSKEEGMIALRAAVWTEALVICHATSKSTKNGIDCLNLLKKLHNLKDETQFLIEQTI